MENLKPTAVEKAPLCEFSGCESNHVYLWTDPNLGDRKVASCVRDVVDVIKRAAGYSYLTSKVRYVPRHLTYKDHNFSVGVHSEVNCITWVIYGKGNSRWDRPKSSSGAFYDVPGSYEAWSWAVSSAEKEIDRQVEHFEKLMKEITEELDEEERQGKG